MNSDNSLKKLEPQIRAAIDSGKVAEFETHGFSMIPLLHDGGDKVRLIKPDGRLKVNDVALCVTDAGKYVLHRVIEVKDSGYVLRGDNCTGCEFCKDDSDVIGVASAFIRRGKLIETTSFSYRLYCRFRKFLLKLWRAFWFFADRAVSLKSK